MSASIDDLDLLGDLEADLFFDWRGECSARGWPVPAFDGSRCRNDRPCLRGVGRRHAEGLDLIFAELRSAIERAAAHQLLLPAKRKCDSTCTRPSIQ